eukprot:TRINITY_DN53372_c0_g1_i1.p1 TRINITY_DN53372_c0_g1~~TRINITY_DN53372_c0_g1_i1.p1  ORF type:complete len:233 (+),score=36.38 TRINITY_DN53372_c0_g1_i1:47-745(+)
MILFATVAALHDDRVFSSIATEQGNFESIANKLLSKINQRTSRMTYVYEEKNFHYIVDSEVIFLCACDERTSRKLAFAFLEDVAKHFFKMYIEPLPTLNAEVCRQFKDVLQQKIDFFSNEASSHKLKSLQTEINKVKDIMVDNIDKVLERGDRIEDMVDRTDDLTEVAEGFMRSSKKVAQKMWWRNVKFWLAAFAVVAVVIFVIIVATCGIKFHCGHNSPAPPPVSPPPPPQ